MKFQSTCRLALFHLTLIVVWSTGGNAAGSSFEDGLAAYDHGDYAVAVEIWQPLAEQGNADAQVNLGHMYQTARGVAWDDSLAAQWYEQAALQGNARGQFSLGAMYAISRGVAKDYATAVDWFRKAAEQGYADAQNALGYMYALGHGVTKDDARALEWYRKAAAQGNGDAEANLGNVYTQGRGVAKDPAEAAVWYHKAAEHGSQRAKRILASPTGAEIARDAAPPMARPDVKPIKKVAPEYPAGALFNGVTGRVSVRMLVDETGSVVAVQIVSATPHRGFESAVRAACKEWKFNNQDSEWVGTVSFDFH